MDYNTESAEGEWNMMKKDLKEWQNELKQKGYKVALSGVLSGNEVTIKIEKEGKRAQLTIYTLGKPGCRLRHDVLVDKELSLFLLEEIEKLYEKWEIKIVSVLCDWDLEERGYVFFDKRWKKSPRDVEPGIVFLKYITKSLKEMKKEDLSFVLKGAPTNGVVKIEFQTFYQRSYLYVSTKKNNIIVSLPESKEEMECTLKDFPTYIKTWFEKEEQQERMKSLFQKKHPYFNNFLRGTELECFKFYEEERTKISELLLTRMKYEEIESVAKEKLEKNEKVLYHKYVGKSVAVIPFGEYFVFFRTGEDEYDADRIEELQLYEKNEKENIIREFERIVTRWSIGKQKTDMLNTL